MTNWFLLLLMSLTAFRVTWFVTEDNFPMMVALREKLLALQRTAKVRTITNDEGEQERAYYGWKSWPADLISCYWCVSVWVSTVLVLLVWIVQPLPLIGLWIGAVAALSAIISALMDR